MPTLSIDESKFSVCLRDGDTSRTIDLDLLETRLALESVERSHDIAAPGWTVTPEFLRDLAAALAPLGLPDCSPTVAYQIWNGVVSAWADVKKNMSAPRT